MIFQKALEERERLERKIRQIEKKLKKFPQGKMYINRSGKWTKWYYTLGPNTDPIYISKKDRILAEKFALKRYLMMMKKDMEQEKRAIDFYLRHHIERPWKSETFLEENPQYQELLLPYIKPISQELYEWANAPYNHNPNYPEQLIYKIPNGQYVRSKSEMLIAMFLINNHIPFRYECALQLGDTVVYPDFTIRHPKTGKVWYFEHFGMMDNAYYSQKACDKLQLYANNGIVPTINMLMTFETKEHPLDVEYVEFLINTYFL